MLGIGFDESILKGPNQSAESFCIIREPSLEIFGTRISATVTFVIGTSTFQLKTRHRSSRLAPYPLLRPRSLHWGEAKPIASKLLDKLEDLLRIMVLNNEL